MLSTSPARIDQSGARPRYNRRDDSRRTEFEAEALPHLPTLSALALRLTNGDEHRSADLVQETALRAFVNWETYELGTNCRGWLCTILRHLAYNEHRKRKRRRRTIRFRDIEECRETEIPGRDAGREPWSPPLDREVLEALASLPPHYRKAVILSDLGDRSYAEVADRLGVPVGTVKSRLSRGRQAMRERLCSYAIANGYISRSSARDAAVMES